MSRSATRFSRLSRWPLIDFVGSQVCPWRFCMEDNFFRQLKLVLFQTLTDEGPHLRQDVFEFDVVYH